MWSQVNRGRWARGIMSVAVLGVASICSFTAMAQSPSHAYINQTRSSTLTNYFVSIGAEGEFGLLSSSERPSQSEKEKSKDSPSVKSKAKWQGYGIRNEIGLEFLKFLQFNLGHTSLNLRSKDDSTENISGSRFNAGAGLTFYAPLGNLRFGGGFLGSRLDYRQQDNSSSYYGSGYYYDIGYDYFINYNVSFYLAGKRNFENLVHNSGKVLPGSVKAETTSAGMGFKIWL